MHFLTATQPVQQVTDTVADSVAETAHQSFSVMEKIVDALVDKSQAIIGAIIILVVGWYLCNFICKILKKTLEKSKVDDSVASFINSIAKFGLRLLVLLIVVTKLGVDTTSIIALITSASLAVGLALQGSLSNFAGGVLLLILKPFAVGDYINDGAGHEGVVTSIEIIYTKLTTADNQIIWVPNGGLANSVITNVSKEAQRRIDFEVGISYDENIDHVRDVLLEVAKNCEYVDQTNNVASVFVSSFDKSSVKVVLRVFCDTPHFWDTKFEIQENIKRFFDVNDITIPYEKMDINIVSK